MSKAHAVVGFRKLLPTGKETSALRFALLLVAACCWPCAAAEEGSDARVGSLGNLAAIQFEGQQHFSSNQLQRGLRYQLDYIFAGEPDRPLSEFLQTIEELLHSGYQRAGFGESKVSVGLNSASNRVVVRIAEGPRLYSGKIRVSGLRTIATNEFIKELEQELRVSSRTNGAAAQAAKAGLQDEPPLWDPEGPAALDPVSWGLVETAVTNALAQLGYRFAEFTVDFARVPREAVSPDVLSRTNNSWMRARAEGRVVDMVIQVNREGPVCTVGDVEVRGSSKNAAADVRRFLGLKMGDRLTEKWRKQQVEQLEESGRFVGVSLDPKGGEQDGHVVAVFNLEDLPEAPPLAEPLPDECQALLRLRSWLLGWDQRREDLVFRLSSGHGTNAVELIVSPSGKVFARFAFQRPGAAGAGLTFGLLASRGLVAMQSSQVPRLFLSTNFQGTLTLMLRLNVDAAAAADWDSRSGITIGLGFESKGEDKPPLASNLKLMPAFFTYLARRPEYVWKLEGNTLTGTHSNVVLRLDKDTGRLLAFGGHNSDTNVAGLFQELDWSLRFEENYLSGAEADWRRSGPSLGNACNEKYFLSSALAFLAETACRTVPASLFRTNVPPEARTRARAVMGKLFRAEMFEPGVNVFSGLNRLEPDEAAMQTVAKTETRELTARQPLVGWAAVVLAHLPDLVPNNSWLDLTLRSRLLAFMGRGERVEPRMRRFFADDDFGPIATLVLGSQLNSQTARNLAVHGLVRADAASFARDLAPLLDERCAAGQMVAEFGKGLARLDEKELEALASALEQPEASLIRRCASVFREPSSQALSERLRPALEEWWNGGFKERVKADLRRLMREG